MCLGVAGNISKFRSMLEIVAFISNIANFCPANQHFKDISDACGNIVPMQFLGPAEKGTKAKGVLLLISENLSGLNAKGSGQIFGSR